MYNVSCALATDAASLPWRARKEGDEAGLSTAVITTILIILIMILILITITITLTIIIMIITIMISIHWDRPRRSLIVPTDGCHKLAPATD